ncbi:MAG: hypothetical protein CME63_04685 [Halobacteriovoraceae bacterium]|mgnify:CR=1 FL=1|nr:hypothetical protein [Halobacteriovoraceae bacterium]MBC97020.1 hypothetical protein [Halobacteriovoraceae bacterium]
MKTLRNLFSLCLFLTSTMAMAAPQIICTTPRESKVVLIKDTSVALSTPEKLINQRTVASVSSVRTKLQGKGFTKIIFLDGIKHTIHIENQNDFSDVNDYMVMRSQEGHEITYPLTCNK